MDNFTHNFAEAVWAAEPHEESRTTLPILLLVAVFFAGLSLLGQSNHEAEHLTFWESHPITGKREEYFSWARATFRSVFRSKQLVDIGYAKYSKRNEIFTAPSIDRGAFAVIPPAQLKDVYGLPESKVDVHWSQSETIQATYTVGNPEIFETPLHINVIRNQITRSLDSLTAPITEEIDLAFERHWGMSPNWKSIAIWPSTMKIAAASVNRVFMGQPHCRDDSMMKGMKGHAEWIFTSAMIINSLPAFLRPIIGGGIWLYGKRVRARSIGPLLPLIQSRIDAFLANEKKPKSDWDPPRDGLQWLIDESFKTGDAKFMDAWRIGHRLLILNFVSMHTTSFSVTNALQDLFSTDPAIGTIEDLREESAGVLREAGGVWSKKAVDQLVLLDSTIRESMRKSSFSVLALPRRVCAPEGITTPSGVHIPCGIPLATPMDAIHFDPAYYADPQQFHPFRFCTPAQVNGTRTQRAYSSMNLDPTVPAPKATVTLDDKFLAFGFGRFACPGRFFALHEMKLIMAHILTNYDIEFMTKRPEQFRIMWVQLPYESTHMRVRRRPNVE